MNSVEDYVRFARNEGVREAVAYLREGQPERAYSALLDSFLKQARLSGLLWDDRTKR